MTARQIGLISQLCSACWQHNEKLSAKILLELLGQQVNAEVAAKVKEMMKPN